MNAHAVVQHLRAFGGLHEQLVLVHADIRLDAGRTSGQNDAAALAADGERQVARLETALAERFAHNQHGFLEKLGQILSSQRTMTGGNAAPGITVISRRTSR